MRRRLRECFRIIQRNLADFISVAALGEVVKISIGPEKKLYTIHKDLICHHSEYFRAAYNGRWKESEDGVELEDVEPEVFGIFVHWLYLQRMPKNDRSFFHLTGSDIPKHNRLLLLKACVFGDRFMAFSFKKAAHNQYIDSSNFVLWYEHVIYAFGNLAGDDLLLKAMVGLHCYQWSPDQDEEDELALRAELPHSFLVSVMIRQQELLTALWDTYSFDVCQYHLHDSNEERQACAQCTPE